jgi:hypothetical protein
MNTASYGPSNALVDIIAAPARALDEVRHHVAWLWWPLLISVGLTIAAFATYFLWVDFDWMIDEMVRAMPPGTDPAVADSMRGFLSPGRQVAFSAIGIVLMTFVIYGVQAAYLHLVNKVAGEPSLRYGQWFAFSAWTAFPGVFQALIILVVILLADSNQVAQHELMPISFNALFIHAEPGSPWFNWGNSISLVNLWMLGLMTLGIMRWTGAGVGKCRRTLGLRVCATWFESALDDGRPRTVQGCCGALQGRFTSPSLLARRARSVTTGSGARSAGTRPQPGRSRRRSGDAASLGRRSG